MARRPVAVLGGGHGGHMMAVDLTSRGYMAHFFWGLWIWNDFMPAFIIMGTSRGTWCSCRFGGSSRTNTSRTGSTSSPEWWCPFP